MIRKNTEALFNTSKDIGLEVNIEKTKYMLMPHHQNVRHNYNIKIATEFFKNVL
jgi:hypothetical protein